MLVTYSGPLWELDPRRSAGADETDARRDANDDARAAGVRTAERECRNDAELPATAGARADRRHTTSRRATVRTSSSRSTFASPARPRKRSAPAARSTTSRICSSSRPTRFADSAARDRSVAGRRVIAQYLHDPRRRESATERRANGLGRGGCRRIGRGVRAGPPGHLVAAHQPGRHAGGARALLDHDAAWRDSRLHRRATGSTRATRPTSWRRRISPRRCASC